MSISQTQEKITLSEKDKKFIQEWEQWKQKGFWRFILFNGISWGLLTGIPMWVMHTFIDEVYRTFWAFFIHFLVVLILGIVGFAPLMWYINERQYKFLKKKGNK